MKVLCEEHELNLTSFIYMEKKIFEDKVKFQIMAIQIEKKLSESMKKFQEAIIRNVDSYLSLSIKDQKLAFEHTGLNVLLVKTRTNKKLKRDQKVL